MTVPAALRRSRPSTVVLRIDADREHLPVIRGVATSLTMAADCTVDEIADLTLAVDETCATLILLAAPGAALDCQFRVTAEEIGFRGIVRTDRHRTPDCTSFGWTVLTTLTDTVHTQLIAATGTESARLRIEIIKRRRGA